MLPSNIPQIQYYIQPINLELNAKKIHPCEVPIKIEQNLEYPGAKKEDLKIEQRNNK